MRRSKIKAHESGDLNKVRSTQPDLWVFLFGDNMTEERNHDPMKILSLGAGVQSSTIFLMGCYGELQERLGETFDTAIFADTGWESKEVYEWFKFLRSKGEKHGVKIHTVTALNRETNAIRNIKEDALVSQVRGDKSKGKRHASLPYFILGPEETMRRSEIGKKVKFRIISQKKEMLTFRRLGMIRRQCTGEYKIIPIEKLQRKLAGYEPRKRIPAGTIETWKGISTDEMQRASMSTVKWIEFYYPLIELQMSRNDCKSWFEKKGLPGPPRSSCLGCPYHSKNEWRHIKNNSPEEWEETVAFDKSIRKCGGMRGDVFLHADRVPLDEVDLSTPEDHGQMSFFSDECAGVCGV